MDDLLVYFVFAACVLFVVGYTALARGWWHTRVGLAMGLRDIVIALTLLPQVLHFAFGLSLVVPWFHWYWRGSLLTLGLVTLWRFWVIWSVQHGGGGNAGGDSAVS